jgi:adenine-specific DNA-methyltransferase
LKQKGILTFITSNSWMRTEYGEKTRQLFSNNNPLLIITFEGNQIFDNAIVDSNILIIQKAPNQNQTNGIKIKEIETSIADKVESEKVVYIGTKAEIDIKETIENIGLPLSKWAVNINRGLTTGFNDAFFIDDKVKSELVSYDNKNEEVIKLLIRGRLLDKFYTPIINSNIIFSDFDENIPKNNPSIYSHLLQFQEQLEKRYDKGKNWYNLRACKYYNEFSKPKIFWIQLSDKNRFTYTEEEVFATNSCFMMTANSNDISLKYLLAVLNSKLVLYYYKMIGSSSGMGTLEWTGVGTQKIPIPKIESKSIINSLK